MDQATRLRAFINLGKALGTLSLNESRAFVEKAKNENGWFTEENIRLALEGIRKILKEEQLLDWVKNYSVEPTEPKTVGVVMAGNIPLVGFHDFLCVLVSGNKLKAKLSSQDAVLPKLIFDKLKSIEPGFADRVTFEENLKNVDALIATGSDNTARYFEYYFRNIPHIIRKNRASCAVILGEEPVEELRVLGTDVFSYFGLGCRNVSKLYVPDEFDLGILKESWERFAPLRDHNKYANNYDYQRSIALVGNEPFIDLGFILLKESKSLVSPIAVLYYERYSDRREVVEKTEKDRDKLQVVVSAQGWFKESVPFGKAQFPTVTDYADKTDTMKFLTGI